MDTGRGTVWLVLGSGICSPGIISQQDDVRLIPSKVICVEIDETAREVADFANPKTPTFPGIIHEFYDVNAMTPEWIRENANSITLVCISMPCKDMTTLTLQKPRNESDRRRQEAGQCRPGLDGNSGKLTRKALSIANTLSSLNPKITVIKENVAFEDLTEDWRDVEKSMGTQQCY